jgi:two-component system sensor histidine kinase KdpD
VKSRIATFLLTVAAVALATVAARVAHFNVSTTGFLFLLVVLGSATIGGLKNGILASVLSTVAFNYFFLPPLHTFHVSDAENWAALAAFLVVATVASRLVTQARDQAERAEARTREVQTLYAERERLLVERAHVEALRESESMRTALLRAVSHDLSTPLTAITVQVASLQRQLVGQSTEKLAAHLAEEVGRLRRRIENLLSMARLETGSLAPRPEPIPPPDLFRAARENLGASATGDFAVRVAPECPDVFADPSLALEILVNLVENARRASPPDAGVELVADRHPRDAQTVRLGVLDRGRGIGANGDSEPGDVPPRGLGLEIARRFAEASGGVVELEARAGGGTCAWIDLPAAAPDREGADARPAHPHR